MKVFHQCTVAFVIASSCFIGCGSNSDATGSNNGQDSQMAQDSAQSSDDAASADNATSGHGPSSNFLFADETLPTLLDANATVSASVRVSDCNAMLVGQAADVNSVWTLDANLAVDANTCSGKRRINGTSNIVATWSGDLATYARMVNVTSNTNMLFSDGSYLHLSVLDAAKSYTAQLQATGQSRDGNTQSIVSLNEHRVLYSSANTIVYDHNVTTPTPVTVDSNFSVIAGVATPVSRTLVSGEVEVHHNLAHFTAQHKFTNVFHDLTGQCSCPSAGTIEQDVTLDSGNGSYTRTYAFTGCGTVTITTSASTLAGTANGTTSATWDNCQN